VQADSMRESRCAEEVAADAEWRAGRRRGRIGPCAVSVSARPESARCLMRKGGPTHSSTAVSKAGRFFLHLARKFLCSPASAGIR